MNPGKDWMGIYKKGTSSDWSNVIDWKWVKDLSCHAPKPCHDEYKMPDLGQGEYVIRYFENNSYTTSASKDFKITGDVANSINLKSISTPYYNEDKKTIYVELKGDKGGVKPNAKDWIGIYKVGAPIVWSNVKKWTWVKNFENTPGGNNSYYKFKNVSLEAGKYEVRYFLNNTGMTFKKSEPFEIKKESENNASIIKEVQNYCSSKEPQEVEGIVCKESKGYILHTVMHEKFNNQTPMTTFLYEVDLKTSTINELDSVRGGTFHEGFSLYLSFVKDFKNSNVYMVSRKGVIAHDEYNKTNFYYLGTELFSHVHHALNEPKDRSILDLKSVKLYDNNQKISFEVHESSDKLGSDLKFIYDISNPKKVKLISKTKI